MEIVHRITKWVGPCGGSMKREHYEIACGAPVSQQQTWRDTWFWDYVTCLDCIAILVNNLSKD